MPGPLRALSPLPATLLAAALLAAPPGVAQPAARPDAVRQDVSGLLAETDALYRTRDDPAAMAELRARLGQAEKLAPNDYEVLWRLSRLHFWLADDPKL